MHRSKILLVDDEKKNIKLLKGMLFSEDYTFFEALNGEEAIDLAHEISPDIILLDVMMPGTSGFDVCRQLKQDEKTKPIPIVMVTALRENEHRLEAMDSGADDFISKPVDKTEVTVRVKSLLRIKSYHNEIAKNYEEIAAKNKNLVELEKIKDGLTHMIVHDLRSPLSAIMGFIEMVMLDKNKLAPKQFKILQDCLVSCEDLRELITTLLDIYKMEEGKMQLNIEATDLSDLIYESIQQMVIRAAEKKIAVSYDHSNCNLFIPIDRNLLKRVLANLLNNAIRHTPTGGRINIKAESDQKNGNLHIQVIDTGHGLAPEFHQKIFNKFEQVKLKKSEIKVGASGLGLAFCKLAVEAHGGMIWVESGRVGQGANFQFTLPVRQSQELPA